MTQMIGKGRITWGTVKIAFNELNELEPMKLLREERNRRIAETDWWASSDLTMSAERTAYRQALARHYRNLTHHLTMWCGLISRSKL